MQLLAQDYAEIVSALKAAGASKGSEQRRAARMELQAQVKAFPCRDGIVGQLYTALTRDLSFKGIGLFQSKSIPQGQQFVVILPRGGDREPLAVLCVGGDREPLAVLCVVMYCRAMAEGLYNVGASFAKPFDFESPGGNILGGGRHGAGGGTPEDELKRIRQSILD
jgi:hypothetical protein